MATRRRLHTAVTQTSAAARPIPTDIKSALSGAGKERALSHRGANKLRGKGINPLGVGCIPCRLEASEQARQITEIPTPDSDK